MENYLGDIDVTDNKDLNPCFDHTPTDWTLYFIQCYGSYSGSQHKDWVLDQIARVLKGCKVQVKLAQWGDLILNGENSEKIIRHEELRISVVSESDEYLKFVADCKDGEDGPETFEYNIGIAP